MSRILDMNVREESLIVKEDRRRNIAEGVEWRRRRFAFNVDDNEATTKRRPEALCINEVTIAPGGSVSLSPALAAQFPRLTNLSEIENAYWATTFAKGALRASGPTTRETRLYVNTGPILYGDAPREVLAALIHGQGTSFESVDDMDKLDALDPQLVELNDGKFGVARFLPAIPLSRLLQNDDSIIAAINAGFFLNFPEEYDDGVSALHQPVGGHIIEGRMVSPPWLDRPGIIHARSGETISRIFGPADMELCINDLPPVAIHKAGTGAAHGSVLRFFDDPNFTVPPDAVALNFTGPLLISATKDVGLAPSPPRGGATVFVDGKHARAALGPTARFTLRIRQDVARNVEWMVSAGPFLVRDAKQIYAKDMLSAGNAGEFRPGGPAPTRFPFDVEKTRAPRTALGVMKDGSLKMVVVDGRNPGKHSCGVTLGGIAAVMQVLGCDSAINLDGGGSSVMAIANLTEQDRLRDDIAAQIANIPSDDGGRERIVPLMITARRRR
ncbi:phosphodiester glycosidase family protein [Candidatus Sumerlaeota bacterium]|nr:phosphodiester glycosidase family protein [Candidatus Sumerlaeota bacterium]